MRRREFIALTAPSVIVMFGFLLLPLYRTVEWSLQRVNYGSPGDWVGLSNYTDALTDPRFGRAVLFTVGLTLVAAVILVIGGYILAVLVNGLKRTRPLVLGILLVAYVTPHVVGASMFSWLFSDNFGGVVNYLLGFILPEDINWFVSPWPNRFLLLLHTIWSALPFAMLVILAGLQGVPTEIVEAAEMDGATPLRRHLHVIVPTIKGVLAFVALISIMDVLRIFDALIPLSPQATQINNESIMFYIYSVAFKDGGQQLGLGSAVNVISIIIILILLAPFIRDIAKEGQNA